MIAQIVEEKDGLLESFGVILFAQFVTIEFIRRKSTNGRKMVLS